LKEPTIGFLNGVIHRLAHRYFEQEFRSTGLHRGMIHILKELEARDGVPQQELCCSLSLDKANVARILGRMERAGLVVRITDSADGRAKNIYLTGRGREMLEPLNHTLKRWSELLTGDMTDEEILVLKKLLMRSIAGIRENLENTEGDRR